MARTVQVVIIVTSYVRHASRQVATSIDMLYMNMHVCVTHAWHGVKHKSAVACFNKTLIHDYRRWLLFIAQDEIVCMQIWVTRSEYSTVWYDNRERYIEGGSAYQSVSWISCESKYTIKQITFFIIKRTETGRRQRGRDINKFKGARSKHGATWVCAV